MIYSGNFDVMSIMKWSYKGPRALSGVASLYVQGRDASCRVK
jgi:hypothetical protein